MELCHLMAVLTLASMLNRFQVRNRQHPELSQTDISFGKSCKLVYYVQVSRRIWPLRNFVTGMKFWHQQMSDRLDQWLMKNRFDILYCSSC